MRQRIVRLALRFFNAVGYWLEDLDQIRENEMKRAEELRRSADRTASGGHIPILFDWRR